MSNHARRYKLSEFRRRADDEGAITIETDDGTEFVIPAPANWPDEFRRVARATGNDPEAIARCIIGDETYDEFVAKGGSARILDAIIVDAQGATPGE